MTTDELRHACIALVNHGANANQGMVLLLAEHGPVSMRDIFTTGGYTSSNATGTVDFMCSKGWVERTTDEQDRRKVMVKISEPGIALLRSIKKQLNIRQ